VLSLYRKKYGKLTEHWMREIKNITKLSHVEQVVHREEKSKIGNGHAIALVAFFRSKRGN